MRKPNFFASCFQVAVRDGCLRNKSKATIFKPGRKKMPYIIAWLLGVPVSILVIIWLFSHVF